MRKLIRFAGMPLGWVVAAATAGYFSAGQADAQNAASSSEPAGTAARNAGVLEEIIVTANKREERIQDVPIAITAVTGDRLADVGITSTMDLSQVVSGLAVQTGAGGTQPHLRGVGTTAQGAGTENSVATYIDNVYILSVPGGLIQLNNISQIEVLKGPQGTLFGRNATGGIINIRTRDPQQELGGDVTVRYGNYETVATQGYLTGGLTETLSADLAVFASNQSNGWGKNVFTGKDVYQMDQYTVRSKWLFEPTESDKFRFIADYSRMKGDLSVGNGALPGVAVNYGPGTALAIQRPDLVAAGYVGLPPAPLSPVAEVGDPYVRRGGFYDIDSFEQPRQRFNTKGVSLQWDHEFETLRFTSISAYREATNKPHWSNIPVPADRANAGWRLEDTQFSQELQLGSTAGADVQWVTGLFYLKGTSDYPEFTIRGTSLSPFESLTFHADTSTESGAAFGQVTVPVWSGANITGGLRYTIEERSIKGDTVAQALPALAPIIGFDTAVLSTADDSKTFRKLTWRIALDQRITPNVLAYVSYNRGFKSGQYNAVPPSETIVEPEILDAYELGLKTDLFDNHVRLNIAGFYYDYKDLQVTVYHTASAVLDNGAATEIYGMDVDLTANIGSHLTLNVGGTLMHSEFTSYPDAGFFTPVPASDGGGTLQEQRSAKGNKVPYAPDYTFNVGANYAVPLGDGAASLNVNYAYSDGWYSGADNILGQSSYGLLDGSFTYTFPGDKLEAGVWARNITDKKYYQTLVASGNPGGYQLGVTGAPRTYGVMIGYKF